MKHLPVYIGLIFFVVACQKFQLPDLDTQISKHGDDESHNKGQNCMDCHYSAGNAEGSFSLGGSLYGNTQGATVELYRNENGPVLKVIEVDAFGNAFTTEPIDYAGGLYVGVRSAAGEFEWMDDKIYNGGCNLCHGTSIEDPIDVE